MRVVVVDDEPVFLEQLKTKLLHYGAELQTDFQVVAECYSGQEALDRLDALSPDAVFTDIRMGSLDGIELAKAIHARWPHLPVVIVSGFPLFEYALEAMRVGVVDYLVKPLDSAALKVVLQKLLNRVGKFTDLRRKTILWSHMEPNGHKRVADTADPSLFPYALYRAIFIQNVGAPYDTVSLMPHREPDDELFRTELLPCLEEGEEVWLFPTHDERSYLLVTGLYIDGNAKIRLLCERVQTLFARNGLTPSLSYSESFRDPAELNSLMQPLHKSLYENVVIGIDQILPCGHHARQNETGFSHPEEQRIVSLLNKGDIAGFGEYLSHIFGRWEKQRCASLTMEMNLKRIVRLLDQHFRSLDAASGKTTENRIEEMVHSARSFPELAEAFKSMLASVFQLTAIEQGYKDAPTLFAKMEAYILMNIGQPLTLQVLTDKYHVSSTFLCNLFRDCSGKSFVEYVTLLRMRKAQEFMQAYPQMRNKEIAEIVGYTDQNYFSRVFKVIVGKSPTEYRSSL